MLIDSHCHLDLEQFDNDREQVLNACCIDGIRAIVNPGVSSYGWGKILLLAQQYPLIKPAIGLHPCFIHDHDKNDVTKLDELVANENNIIAIGEIGIDLFIDNQDLEKQQWYFAAQLDVAQKYGLPIIIHARKSHDLILKTIRQQKFTCGGTVHAFSGSLQQANVFIDLGFKLGFGGTITYERARKTRRILQQIPFESIVLETDAPDMPPINTQGIRNTPTNLRGILRCAAELLDIPPEQLEQITTENCKQIFSI